MEKVIANLHGDQFASTNAIVNNEVLLIHFYQAKEYGPTIWAYDTFLRDPLNTVVQLHPLGKHYINPTIPLLKAVLQHEIEMGDKNPQELLGLIERQDRLKGLNSNTETKRSDDSTRDSLRGAGTVQMSRKRRR
ncbi:MAG: hypothetical protein H0W89_06940 [Candidatus Levybacteria bacterium]|nr:hypothetical protein [Candidatus Levybacteria bacterium]